MGAPARAVAMRPLLALLPLALLAAVPAPTAAAGCTYDFGTCRGDCEVNLGSCHGACQVNLDSCGSFGACQVNAGTCNWGDCTVNLSWCDATCVVAMGAVGTRVVDGAACKHDCTVDAGNACGKDCSSGAWAALLVNPVSGLPFPVLLCVPTDGAGSPRACGPLGCVQP